VEARSADRVIALLKVVAGVFDEHGEWPTRQYVEAELEQDHGLDLEECLAATPPNLLAAAGQGEDSELALRISGLAAAGSVTIVERFIEALRWCVDAVSGSRPKHPGTIEDISISAEELRAEWAMRNVEVSDLDLKKLRALILLEGTFAGFSGEAHSWSIDLSRRVLRPYRDVRSIKDYLAIRAEWELPPAAPVLIPAQTPLDLPQAGDAPDELPAAVPERVRRLFRDEYFENAALESIKFVTAILRERSGLELDGKDLAGKALSPPDPLVRVVGLGGASSESIQRGLMLIAQGLFQAARNPLAHDQVSLSRGEAIEIIAMAGFIIRAIERADGM
jgi:uncharacterized protein (TIGR02391 family)